MDYDLKVGSHHFESLSLYYKKSLCECGLDFDSKSRYVMYGITITHSHQNSISFLQMFEEL
jgi:hypothetical protein